MSTGNGNGTIAKAPPMKALSQLLNNPGVQSALRAALPKHITPDRMARLALTACVKMPQLLECDPNSIYLALLECSQIGLEPNGRDVHLIPFRDNKSGKTNVQVVPDYKGLIKLAYQSGQIQLIMARAVRDRDEFNFRYGTGAFLEHTPASPEGADDSDDSRGELTHAWAMARLVGGGEPFVVLNRSEVAVHRRSSKGKSGPWISHPDAMWAKTAVKELCKFIPLSAQLERVLSREDERGVIEIDSPTIPPPAELTEVPKSKADALADRMDAPPPESGAKETEAQPADADDNGAPAMVDQLSSTLDGTSDAKGLVALRTRIAKEFTAGTISEAESAALHDKIADKRIHLGLD